jgi:hypothetical protein
LSGPKSVSVPDPDPDLKPPGTTVDPVKDLYPCRSGSTVQFTVKEDMDGKSAFNKNQIIQFWKFSNKTKIPTGQRILCWRRIWSTIALYGRPQSLQKK